MTNFVKGLELYQTGQESTPGTAVAATSVFPYPIDFDDDSVIERPKYALGRAWENAGISKKVATGTTFTVVERPFIYEIIPILMSWGVLGGASTADEATPATWEVEPGNTNPGYKSRTIERRLSNGTQHLDDEWAYAMLTKWSLKWGQRGSVMFSAEGFARTRKDSTLTASQTPPAMTMIPTSLVTVYVDDAFEYVGNTQITGQVIGGEFEYRTGTQHEETADGRQDLDFGIAEFNPDARGFALKLRVKVRNSGFAIAERAKAEAVSPRAIRIKMADAATSQELVIDGLYEHDAATSVVKIGEQDGQDIVEMSLIQSHDGTAAFAMSAEVNALTTE